MWKRTPGLGRPPESGCRSSSTSTMRSGEAGLVAFAREDAAGAGERLARRQVGGGEVRGHFAIHAVDELLFHFMRLGRNVEMMGNATRMARRTQSTSTNGITPRKMVRV